VLFQELEGEAVLLNLETGRYYSLNAVGARIWKLLAAGHSPPSITQQLVAAYEVSPEQAAGDVDRLLADLRAHQLVEVVAAPPGPHPSQP
jgi:hypothetical protein